MKIALCQSCHTLSKQGKKNVILLSTAPPILGITKDDGKSKLEIYIKCMILQKEGQILSTREWGFTLVNQNPENGQ